MVPGIVACLSMYHIVTGNLKGTRKCSGRETSGGEYRFRWDMNQ